MTRFEEMLDNYVYFVQNRMNEYFEQGGFSWEPDKIDRHATASLANTSKNVFNLKHTKFVHNRIEVVKNMLKYYNQEITSFDAIMNRLVTRPMSDEMAIDWFKSQEFAL